MFQILLRASIRNPGAVLRKPTLPVRPFYPERSFHSSLYRLQEDKEEMDDLKKNPYFDKYADKISKAQKTSPEEFLDRLSKVEKGISRPGSPPIGAKIVGQEKDFSFPSKPKRDISPGSVASMTKEKSLNDRMKLDLLHGKSKEEIATIWREYHVTKDAVSAVIPAEMFEKMQERFLQYKTFLFPLPRKEGYEFIVVQFQGKEAHFTTLINYQAHSENAPECLTLFHYTDLAEEKGIVLMVGEYDGTILTHEESSCLGVQTLLYYGREDPKMTAHLNRFTLETDDFNPMDLIAELEVSTRIPLAPLFHSE